MRKNVTGKIFLEQLNANNYSPVPDAGANGNGVHLNDYEERLSDNTFGINQVIIEISPYKPCMHIIFLNFVPVFNIHEEKKIEIRRCININGLNFHLFKRKKTFHYFENSRRKKFSHKKL